MSVTFKIVAGAGLIVLVSVLVISQPALPMPDMLRVVLALALGLAVAGLFARQVTRPIRELTAFVSALSAGDLDQRLERPDDDELGQLARALNSMAGQLQRREARIGAEVSQKAAILATMDEGLLALDGHGQVVLVNDAARRMLGWLDADPLGRRLAEVTRAPDVLTAAQRCLEARLRAQGELTVSGPGGERVLQLMASPVEDSESVRGVLVLHDLTEMRRLEQVRRDFVANVSHELKTPLTSMRGYLEAVLDDPDMPGGVREGFLRKVGLNTARLSSIVSDLLDLARLDDEAGQQEKQPLGLDELVRACVTRAQADAEVRRVELVLAPPSGPVAVRGDPRALATAVSNLLINAIKYSPERGHVEVRVGADQGSAWIDVEDDGPGIARHELERIFERFYRVDKNRSRALGGTGLGLSIVRNVARNHGGDVSVRSAPGQGSTFTIHLPCVDPGVLAAAS